MLSNPAAATPAIEVAEGGVVHGATPISDPGATELRIRNAQLEEQIKGLQAIVEMEKQRTELERQRAEDARERAEELKAERDKWSAALEASQRQITHLTGKAAALEKPRGWWPFRRAG